MSDLLDLTGKRALVTGAGKGIGLAIAVRLAEAGARVVAADNDQASLDALPEKLVPAYLDVADEGQVRRVLQHEVEGPLDILVNNAGIYPMIPLAALEAGQFDRIVAVNLRGVYLLTRFAAETMRPGATIVNITSIDALHPSTVGLSTYDATKHGAWGFTKATALELAPKGIRVNAVAPGGIVTPGTGGADVPADLLAEFTKTIPMGRMGEPDEIAKVVLFLASDLASYMTGSQVVVDGGRLLN